MDPRLGRHIEHDRASRLYPFSTADLTVASVKHQRYIPVLDQGNLGSCTGNATVGALGTGKFYETVKSLSLDEDLAIKIYEKGTVLDNVSGQYPPDDTGSTGIGVAKAAQALGLISGYQHTFSYEDALKALSDRPVIVGINWYNNFFYPDSEGIISVGKNDYVAGGHEIVLDEIDTSRELIGATNSWGTMWGEDGRFFIPFSLFQRLLNEDGDVTVFVPNNQPAPSPTPPEPTPTPVDDVDATLWSEVKAWAHARHAGSNRRAAQSVLKWAAAKKYQ